MNETGDRRWKVGELSEATGLSVRTLHHYDELGLFVPSERSQAGYRLYDEADLRQLYRIVALRDLGLGLGDIAAALDGDVLGLEETVGRQLEAVEQRLRETTSLRDRLIAIRDALAAGGAASIDQLVKTMEALTMHEKYYSADQLERIDKRRVELGSDAIERGQQAWAELFDGLRAEMEAGTDPADRRLDCYRERPNELIDQFTDGDPKVRESMSRMWQNEEPERVSHGMVDRELWDYYGHVCSAGRAAS